ncbi:pyridoxamine 5'-phosphate oxidase family protein [Ornithinimicrobium sp. Y1694]|uniref:pyridoxamine 5'-phosphate oxidase family protein n=1 Tax=Ornithinimicrobium sp. Y1694 TaxID=3418590 RepID=UPI003CF2BE08
MPPRDCQSRKAHALAHLARERAHVWVSTASPRGLPSLIPMSYAVLNGRVLVCTGAGSATSRNLQAGSTVRLAFGQTHDVVLITGRAEAHHAVAEAPAEIRDQFARQADWDPQLTEGDFRYFVLEPRTVAVWAQIEEHDGKTVMKDGVWTC